jgi:DNA mismatch repair ATPase MutS
MSFVTDKQTLDDLNIPGRYRPDSVFSLFNTVITRGGERVLGDMFQHPLTDHKMINDRSATFRHFARLSLTFPLSPQGLDSMEEYLSARGSGSIAATWIYMARKKIMAWVVKDEGYQELHRQVMTTIEQLNNVADFLNNFTDNNTGNAFLMRLVSTRSLFSNGRLHWVTKLKGITALSFASLVKYDHLLRSVHEEEMKKILETIYQLDVCMAVGAVARTKGFSFADAVPKKANMLSAENLRHPTLPKAIGNSISMNGNSNLLFLTGANMAGKSTFMKSFGIAVYLAHMGFPVAAENMVFSIKDGLYTSINVPDDLSLGYSHFYAEVQRVKKVSEEITRPLELFIIFDELFKGTNVKDAHDATFAITDAFADKQQCLFIISTHITEAGEELRSRHNNLQFVYFPSILQDKKPTYTYKLQPGISNDRHGMMIIQQEGILELIVA